MLVAKIYVSRTDIKAEKVTSVTAGMVGAEVDVYFGREWDGYAKTYVWEHGGATIDDTTCSGIIPHEVVAQSGGALKFGVYGTKDGKATPTLWCTVDVVKPGVDPSGDESTDPTLPVWAQILEEIDKLKQNNGGNISDEQIAEALEKYLAENPIEGISEEEVRRIIADYLTENPPNDGEDGGYYTPEVSQPTDDTMQVAFTPSKAGMPAVAPVTVNLPVGSGSGSSANANLTTTQIDALHGMFKVCAYDDSKDVSGAYAAFLTAFGITDSGGGEEEPDTPVEPDEPVTPEKTLTSISATYSGGDVAVGTAVSELTDIVVTTHYSDGTSETVTGYTLSGTIAEGENTVTVSYGGKTTTFTVTGVAESDGATEVAMTQGYYDWSKTEYSDDGTTEYSGAMGSQSKATAWYSNVFEKDTTVTISVLYGTTNGNLRQYAACVSGVTPNANNDLFSDGDTYYMEQIGTASAAEYTAQYTVRAGYRLAILNYNASTPTAITVTK